MTNMKVMRHCFDDPYCRLYLKRKIEHERGIKVDRFEDLVTSIRVWHDKSKVFNIDVVDF